MKNELDQAYWERNQLVALLSKIYPSHLAKHPKSDKTWDSDWMNIVCIHIPGKKMLLPTGNEINRISQATWHIHDDELSNFRHLKYRKNHWDGHTTEGKYERLKYVSL